jgi:hypothetical protein
MRAYITPKVPGIDPPTIMKLVDKLQAHIGTANWREKVQAITYMDLAGKRYHGEAVISPKGNVQWDITKVEAVPVTGTTTKAAAPSKAAPRKAAAKKPAPKKAKK